MRTPRLSLRGFLGVAVALVGACVAAPGSVAPGGTSRRVLPEDLKYRLTAFAHDSMEGREAGTPGHDRGTSFIAAEAGRLGLRPVGEDGTFFQTVPLTMRNVDRSVTLAVDGQPLRLFADYTPMIPNTPSPSVQGAEVVFGGTLGGSASELRAEDAKGRFVVFSASGGAMAVPGEVLGDAVGIGIVVPTPMFEEYSRLTWRTDARSSPYPDVEARPALTLLTRDAAEHMLGSPPAALSPGARGKRLTGDIIFHTWNTTSRNVVAVLPGTDPRLSDEYVAMGAHSDHDGVRFAPLAGDSLRAELWQASRGTSPPAGDPTASPVDSIFNGADDDGSGSVALLEIAEWLGDPANRPKRSVLFVWHTAEEKGMVGSRWYTDHPTVSLADIAAQINIDMIGRGSAADVDGGGPDYLQVLGWRRLSTELGDLVEAANRDRAVPFRFDTQFDAPGHPENFYCRSDHWMYARFGIPVAFFSTGDHPDYHQLTDEARFIDYHHYAEVTGFMGEVVRRVGNMDHRPALTGPRPDPTAPCRQ